MILTYGSMQGSAILVVVSENVSAHLSDQKVDCVQVALFNGDHQRCPVEFVS